MFESITQSKRSRLKPVLALAVVLLVFAGFFVWLWRMTQMPLKSYEGPLPPLTAEEAVLRSALAEHMVLLAGTLPRFHGYRHRTVSVPSLSHTL